MKNTKQTGRAKKRPAKIKEEAVSHLFGLLEGLRGEADDSLIEELQRHLFSLSHPFASNYWNWSKKLRAGHKPAVNEINGGS